MSVSSPDALPNELRGKFAAIRRWQNVSRAASILTVLVVAGMFAVFAKTTQDKIKANFNDQAEVSAQVNKAVLELNPVVATSLEQLLKDVAPAYREKAAERYQVVRDNMGTKAMIRLQKLPEDGGKLMGSHLSEVFDRVLKAVEPDVQKAFPSLTDAQRRDILIDYFNRQIEDRNKRLATHVEAVWVTEASKLKATLDKFALPPDEAAPADEQLRKELAQTMFLLAAEYFETEPATAAAPGARPAPVAKPASDVAPAAK